MEMLRADKLAVTFSPLQNGSQTRERGRAARESTRNRLLRSRSSVPCFTFQARTNPYAQTARISRLSKLSCYFGKCESQPNASTDFLEDFKKARTVIRGMTFDELEAWVKSCGFKAGQATLLWKCLYGSGKWMQTMDEMKGLNKKLIQILTNSAKINTLTLKDLHCASDGTKKILFCLEDGLTIETVLIPFESGRRTICVSSQVGCGMNCQFCFTGRMGLKRNLSTAEIVEQVVYACHLFTKEVGPLTNVVFMGMGEPLHNIDNVMKAVRIMVDCHGLHFSPRKVTVSTSGLVPQIKQFLRESPCELAVSLNATTDEVRNWIMPINRKYNLQMLLSVLREEIRHRRNYKVLFEYVMLAGINDSLDDARRLLNLVEGIRCKINLIPFNLHHGSPFIPSSPERIMAFQQLISNSGITASIRQSRGSDQMAACGQLGNPNIFKIESSSKM